MSDVHSQGKGKHRPNEERAPGKHRAPSGLLLSEELIVERRFENLREEMQNPKSKKPLLLIATTNEGKVREFRELLKDVPARFVSLLDAHITQDVEETGTTFAANASLKAATYARLGGLWALAEDSGLEVDALGGEPGVYSRRYAGVDATDAERVQYLLSKLRNVPWERRGARFRSVIAIASPGGVQRVVEGECQGVVALAPKGAEGFGYDPVFWLPELGRTVAELSLEEKNRVSHRSRSAAKAVAALRELVGNGALT
jgi:XTP/dITP diphosphohydrolase